MSFETALVEELAVGELANKVFPLSAPEGTTSPYLVYLSSDGVPEKTLGGFLESITVSGEMNIVAATYAGMKTLTVAVLSKFRSFEGRVIGTDGPFIQAVHYEQPVELYEQAVKQYRCLIDFRVNF